jgi:hypothetical protein
MSEKERWRRIKEFPGYSVSDRGQVRADKTGRILALNENQFGVVAVGMMRDGKQYHRSVPLLVAKAFVKGRSDIFDTPINLDGNRWNNNHTNLVWRPRWFAFKYNRQIREPYVHPILLPLQDVKTGEITVTSFKTAKRYGLLESDIVLSIANRTPVFPTWQEFRVLES